MEQKPMILELEEAKTSFIQFINSLQQKGLPLYLIDMALSGVYAQLKEGVRSEIAMARQQMQAEKQQVEDTDA